MTEDLRAVLGFVAVGAGTLLIVFAIGAQSGWLWATKSLEAPRPPWIAGVLAAGGLCYVAFAALLGDWLSALLTAGLYAIMVGGSLRIGPFARRSGGGKAP
jgi:hypothetical protein